MLEWIKENPDRTFIMVVAAVNLFGGIISKLSPKAAELFSLAGPDLIEFIKACIPAKKKDPS